MENSGSTWLAIMLVAGVVYATRIAGALLVTQLTVTPRLTRFLDALAASVIAALVASSITMTSTREAVAAGIALAVGIVAKSTLLAMCAGILAAALWANFVP
jgi:uncharacterized membrane protein